MRKKFPLASGIKKIILFIFVLSAATFAWGQEKSQPIDLSLPLEPAVKGNAQENVFEYENRMPNDVLCFPPFSQDYLRKIDQHHSGRYEVWSENQISAWAQAQGFRVTKDNTAGDYRFQYAMIFYAPGLEFNLKTPASDNGDVPSPFGWKLVLDMGFLQSLSRKQLLSSDFKFYENILRYTIFIDGIEYRTVEMGYGKTPASPIEIPIPYIRDVSGRIRVEIRLNNHPSNFAILYDAFVSRQ